MAMIGGDLTNTLRNYAETFEGARSEAALGVAEDEGFTFDPRAGRNYA